MMTKRILVLSCLLVGCSVSRNEYGNYRVPISRFSIQPNSNDSVYQLIDTSSIYMQIGGIDRETIKDSSGNNSLSSGKDNTILFYKNGRLGWFGQVDLKDVNSFEPKRANMGIYNYGKKGFFASLISHSVQAGVFQVRYPISVKGDTLFLGDDQYKDRYLKRKFPKNLLRYAADW